MINEALRPGKLTPKLKRTRRTAMYLRGRRKKVTLLDRYVTALRPSPIYPY